MVESIILVINLIIVGFAGYGLGNLMVDYEGPLDIFEKYRRLIGITEDIENKMLQGNAKVRDNLNFLAKMFTCNICATTALTLLFSITLFFPESIIYLSPLAALGVVFKLNE